MGSFFWITVAILVLCATVGVIAAFWDRKRARKIERDLQTPLEETEERNSHGDL